MKRLDEFTGKNEVILTLIEMEDFEAIRKHFKNCFLTGVGFHNNQSGKAGKYTVRIIENNGAVIDHYLKVEDVSNDKKSVVILNSKQITKIKNISI